MKSRGEQTAIVQREEKPDLAEWARRCDEIMASGPALPVPISAKTKTEIEARKDRIGELFLQAREIIKGDEAWIAFVAARGITMAKAEWYMRRITGEPESIFLPPARPGTLYFIQRGDDGPVKIGMSADVPKRMKQLQCASSDELHLRATVPTSELTEREAHRRFKAYRLRGEWFRAAAELLAFIEENRSKS